MLYQLVSAAISDQISWMTCFYLRFMIRRRPLKRKYILMTGTAKHRAMSGMSRKPIDRSFIYLHANCNRRALDLDTWRVSPELPSAWAA